ncbi:MAG: CHASE4 domain-containing protein [Methanomicrobiales archaeon]
MKLRAKTLLFTGTLFVILILAIFTMSQILFSNTFNVHEKQYTALEVRDVNYTLNNEIYNLKKTNIDWAEWDDAYSFVSGNNPDFASSSLLPETFTRLNLNLILFLDNDNRLVYGKAFDLERNQEINIPSGFYQNFTSSNIVTSSNDSEGQSGIIITQLGPMMVSSHPILTSSSTGPSQGTLIMGRLLNKAELARLSKLTNSSISVENYNNKNLPSDFQTARNALNNNNPIFVQALGPDDIAGYTYYNDIDGNPALILRSEIPRIIYQDYQSSIIYLILSLILMGLLFGVLTLYHLDKNLLNRLEKIVSGVVYIGKSEDLSKRVYDEGEDELSNLGKSVNTMLDSLETSKHQLKESEKRYRNIFENTGTLMIILDENLRVYLANKEFKNVFGYSDEDLKRDLKWDQLFTNQEEDLIVKYHEKLINKEELGPAPETCQLKYEDPSGNVRYFLATFKQIPGTFRILVSLIDVSDRKKAEDEIKASLKEKEALLREIHHRVKNNMQIISSLISLQTSEISDENMVKLYQETENRIHSMALVHENLYQSHDLSHINLSNYIENLVDDLVYSYEKDTFNIESVVEIPKIEVNLETAIPLGLIINELVSNSLKHAFTHGKGKIMVKILIEPSDNLILTVSDNGVGLPGDIDSIESLGLRLVKMLVKQLDGTLTIENKTGTKFKIKFKELDYNKRI